MKWQASLAGALASVLLAAVAAATHHAARA
jgi:hypothetical protein